MPRNLRLLSRVQLKLKQIHNSRLKVKSKVKLELSSLFCKETIVILQFFDTKWINEVQLIIYFGTQHLNFKLLALLFF